MLPRRPSKLETLEAQRLKSALSKVDISYDHRTEFTVEEVEKVIAVLFPKRSEKLYRKATSYGFKHVMERISELFNDSGIPKYCNNRTFISAMQNAGFRAEPEIKGSPNYFFNIETRQAKNLFFLLTYKALLDEKYSVV